MPGQTPTHRVTIAHKQTKECVKIMAGWPSKRGDGVNLRPERDVRIVVEVTDGDTGQVTEHDLADYWIDMQETGGGGGQRRSRPAETPNPEPPPPSDDDIPF